MPRQPATIISEPSGRQRLRPAIGTMSPATIATMAARPSTAASESSKTAAARAPIGQCLRLSESRLSN